MTTPREQYEPFYAKAAQSWLGARAELTAGRFDNAIALAYYACFELAVATMIVDGVPSDRPEDGYSHGLSWLSLERAVQAADRQDLLGLIHEIYRERIRAHYRRESHIAQTARGTMDKAQLLTNFLRQRLDALVENSGVWESDDDNTGQTN